MTNEEDELNFRKDNKHFNYMKYFNRYICYEYIKNTFKPVFWFSSFYKDGIKIKGKTSKGIKQSSIEDKQCIINLMTDIIYTEDDIKIKICENGTLFIDDEVTKYSDNKDKEGAVNINMKNHNEVLYFNYELSDNYIKKIRNTLREYITKKQLKKFNDDLKYVQNFVVELTPLLKMKLDIDL